MSTNSLRGVVRLVLLFSVVFALSLTQGWATTIGSSTTSRPFLDTAAGQVYIFNGDFFGAGETVTGFSWFGPVFSGSRDLTPLLFQDNNGVFTVVAIGATETVAGASGGSTQSVAFGLQAGSALTGSNYTFGFVTGLANSAGTLGGTSAGSINFDSPAAGGVGASGGGTNDWVYTPSLSGINVGLGTTFIIPGSNGTGSFTLNNPSLGGFNRDRTYSAQASSVSGVAEPGTFSLITGAGLVLAGLFRYRHSRGRRG